MRPTQERKIYIIIFSQRASERARGSFRDFYSHAQGIRVHGKLLHLPGKHNKHFKTKTHAAVAAHGDFIFTWRVSAWRRGIIPSVLFWYNSSRTNIHRSVFTGKIRAICHYFCALCKTANPFAKRGEIMRGICVCVQVLKPRRLFYVFFIRVDDV